MILPDKRPVHSDFANLTDYSLECPKDCMRFFAFVRFTDESRCLWSNIFTFNRQCAMMLVLEKFSDCLNYISNIDLYGSDVD